jgi:hypothetical protein
MVRTIDDYIRIAANGGGFSLDARQFMPHQLRTIAATCAGKGRIVLLNCQNLTTDDLSTIAANGKGNVFFEDM